MGIHYSIAFLFPDGNAFEVSKKVYILYGSDRSSCDLSASYSDYD